MPPFFPRKTWNPIKRCPQNSCTTIDIYLQKQHDFQINDARSSSDPSSALEMPAFRKPARIDDEDFKFFVYRVLSATHCTRFYITRSVFLEPAKKFRRKFIGNFFYSKWCKRFYPSEYKVPPLLGSANLARGGHPLLGLQR